MSNGDAKLLRVVFVLLAAGVLVSSCAWPPAGLVSLASATPAPIIGTREPA